MNYQKLYDNIIFNALSGGRIKTKDNYFEKHHVMPRCMGGNNEKSNLVLLTAKEHFVCHHLLTKIYKTSKLYFAYWSMCHQLRGDVHRDYIVTSSNYQEAKLHFSRENSKLHSGKKLSNTHITAIQESLRKHNPHKKGVDSHRYGKKMSLEICNKISKTKLANPKLNGAYCGDYITPLGIFITIREAAITNNITIEKIRIRCKRNKGTITTQLLRYNPDIPKDSVGKTFRELGFDFVPK